MYMSPGIVVGFHGCDKAVFDKVVKQGGQLSNSENDYDWLGHGIYFWEGSYERALEWATKDSKVINPAAIGAFIRLGNCIDLLDSEHVAQVKATYKILKAEVDELGEILPENTGHVDGVALKRELDCKVIQRLQQLNNEYIAEELKLCSTTGNDKRKIQNHSQFIDSMRGMFPEGKELYKDAGFREKNHIQLCIVNPNCIMGYFEPNQYNPWYKKL